MNSTHILEFPILRHSYAINRHSGFSPLEYLHLVCSQVVEPAAIESRYYAAINSNSVQNVW